MEKNKPTQKDLWKFWKAAAGQKQIRKSFTGNGLRQHRGEARS
jgi:hypothetical protein